jgi:4'-phosphopantetheinyl transferase
LIAAAPPPERLRAFFECWTRKEAFIKATGEGLSFPLEEFDASLAPGEVERLLRTDRASSGESLWTLRAFAPDPAYAAAVALEGEGWRLACWRWPEQ